MILAVKSGDEVSKESYLAVHSCGIPFLCLSCYTLQSVNYYFPEVALVLGFSLTALESSEFITVVVFILS